MIPGTNGVYFLVNLPATMRAVPTLATNITYTHMFAGGAGFGYSAAQITAGSTSYFYTVSNDCSTNAFGFAIILQGTGVLLTLANGTPAYLVPDAAGYYVGFSVEM